MKNIKLFVACHKEEILPNHPLLIPVQVGAALAEKRFDGFSQDDEGENISKKNRSYCELTALYWAWKNVEADYYGLFHYRRYLYPDTKKRSPYKLCGVASTELLQKLGYNNFEQLITKYDVITPIAENMYVSVREHYANALYHKSKDLDLAEQILLEKYPEMEEASKQYLSGTLSYFGNITIMKRDIFKDYCGWLFPMLEEFDRRSDLTGYSSQELRVDGYLAERLQGIYFTFYKDKLRFLELPRVHFEQERSELCKKKVLNFILPPGTKCRATAKRIFK